MTLKCTIIDFETTIDLMINTTKKIDDILLPDFDLNLSNEDIAIIRIIMTNNNNLDFFKYISKMSETDFGLKVQDICRRLFAKDQLELMKMVYELNILNEYACTSSARSLLRNHLPSTHKSPNILYPTEVKILKSIKIGHFETAKRLLKSCHPKHTLISFKKYIDKRINHKKNLIDLIPYLVEIGII